MFTRHSRFGVPLALVLAATLALGGALVSPARAAVAATPTVSVTPTTVAPGDTLTVSGSGFAPLDVVAITLSPQPFAALSVVLKADGILPPVSLVVPSGFALGPHTLTLRGLNSHRSVSTQITVSALPATLLLSSSATNRGGLISVSGSGFAPNDTVTLSVAGIPTPLATVKTDAHGQFPPTTVALPYSVVAGTHQLQARGSHNRYLATATLSVSALAPALSVSTATLSPGAEVTVSGRGFGRQEQVTLALNGTALATTPAVVTTSDGAFSASFTVPAGLAPGANTLSASGVLSRVSAVATVQTLIAASTLYFAGVATQPGERAFLAVLNPTAQSAHLDLSFYYADGAAPGQAGVDVAAHSRGTIDLNRLAGAGHSFGLRMVADHAVLAQVRVLRSGQDGYGVLGVAAPSTTWYLAEGYTGRSFHETLALVNPEMTAAEVTLDLLPADGATPLTTTVSVAPRSTQLVDVNRLLPNRSVSVIARASQPIVLARVLTFSTGSYGITAGAGATTPSTSWIFAGGKLDPRYQTYLSVLNPNAEATFVTVGVYGRGGGSLGTEVQYVPAMGRATIRLNDFLSYHTTQVATTVSSDLPVVVERAEYAGDPNAAGARVAGSIVLGRNGPGLSWVFPGGLSIVRAELLFLYNPSAQAAAIDATFYGAGGQVITKRIWVAPGFQREIDVKQLVPGLGAEHSVALRSANGVGFVAEQSSVAPGFSALYSTQGYAG